MRRYLVSGAHIKAMQAFRGMATGKTFGFEAEAPPDWDEVHDLWITKGKEV
jgi:hypothetical protein